MCSPPTGLEVVALLISLHTTPTSMVRLIVRTDGFNDVRRFSVTSFATINLAVLAWVHWTSVDSITLVALGAAAYLPASLAMFYV
jgi:hypothetical protein